MSHDASYPPPLGFFRIVLKKHISVFVSLLVLVYAFGFVELKAEELPPVNNTAKNVSSPAEQQPSSPQVCNQTIDLTQSEEQIKKASEKIANGFKSEYYSLKFSLDAHLYKKIFELQVKIDGCFEELEKKVNSNKELLKSFKPLVLELGDLSKKINLDLKRYENARFKLTKGENNNGTIEIDIAGTEAKSGCGDENKSNIYLKTKYSLFNKLTRKSACDFGILMTGITGMIVHGQESYVSKAYINPYGLVDIKEQGKKQSYAFYSTTAFIKSDFFGRLDRDILFFGVTAGIGLGKDNAVNTDKPSLMTGLSGGITLDDTKFFSLTYGYVWDPNTHQLPYYLFKNFPASAYFSDISGIRSDGSFSTIPLSFLKNSELEVPLKTIMGKYQGWGFSFSYKF